MSNTNTIRSHFFSRTVQQTHDASFDAACVVSKVAHNDLGHPSVHSNKGVDVGTMCYDIHVVKNSPQNPATNKAPGFESEGLGFEPPMAGYESSECEINHSVSGCVSGDLVITEPSGQGFESSQVTDIVVPMNCIGQESGKRDSVYAGKSDLTSSKSFSPECNVNNVGMDEKFVNTIIFANKGNRDLAQGVNTPIFNQCQRQVDFQFGFVPLGCQLMPSSVTSWNSHDYSPIELHKIIRKTGKPNFLQACLPVASQLHVDKWKSFDRLLGPATVAVVAIWVST